MMRAQRSQVDPVWDFLADRYHGVYYYWTVVDMIRRLSCTSGLLLVPRLENQLFVCLGLNVFFFNIYTFVVRFSRPCYAHNTPALHATACSHKLAPLITLTLTIYRFTIRILSLMYL